MKAFELRVLEDIAGYQKFQKESIADAMSAIVEQAKQNEQVSNAVVEMTSKLVQLFYQQAEMNERINRYILDKARDDGRLAKLEKQFSEVRKVAGVG